MKIIRLNDDFPIIVLAIWQIPLEVFEERMEYLGWDLSRKGRGKGRPDYMVLSPDGKQRLTIMAHNWEKNWYDVKRKILQNRDLAFVFETKFEIPKNFNFKTQKIEEKPLAPTTKEFNIPFVSLSRMTNQEYKILTQNNKWAMVADIDFEHNTIMTTDGEFLSYDSPKEIVRIQQNIK